MKCLILKSCLYIITKINLVHAKIYPLKVYNEKDKMLLQFITVCFREIPLYCSRPKSLEKAVKGFDTDSKKIQSK